MWSHAAFKGQDKLPFQNFTDRISRCFTIAILTIAVVAGATWLLIDPGESLHVFTAVLIVACPCALALATPFTLGNMLRIYGKLGLYLKDIHVIEKMANIQTVVFDKTGTLTATKHSEIEYRGAPLTPIDKKVLKNSLKPKKVSHFPSLKLASATAVKSPENISEELLISKGSSVTTKKKGMATLKKLGKNWGCLIFSKKLIILIFDCYDDDRDRALF